MIIASFGTFAYSVSVVTTYVVSGDFNKFFIKEFMSEKKILGVCSWVSDKFDLDVSGIRMLFIIAAILGLGSPILIYLILYLVKPKSI